MPLVEASKGGCKGGLQVLQVIYSALTGQQAERRENRRQLSKSKPSPDSVKAVFLLLK